MKTTTFLAIATVGKLAAAHATFQAWSVNGKPQVSTGVRGTSNQNNPILSTASGLASDMMICKGGAKVAGSLSVAGGDKLTLQWHHNNPSSGAGDVDEPIAESHKGPIITWVAKAETEGKGNVWVKIHESGLSNGKWAVDTFRANAGKIDVTVPDLAAGDYLVRSEIIALHEADRAGGAQFYNGCGQIKVTSAGKLTIGSGAVDIKKVYKTDGAGVKFSIYGGASTYPIPGPKVNAGFSGAAAAPAPAPAPAPKPSTTPAPAPAPAPKPTPAKPTTLSTVVKPSSKAAAPTKGATTGSVARWGQCGGKGYTGATRCVAGSRCQKQNEYYFQCL